MSLTSWYEESWFIEEEEYFRRMRLLNFLEDEELPVELYGLYDSLDELGEDWMIEENLEYPLSQAKSWRKDPNHGGCADCLEYGVCDNCNPDPLELEGVRGREQDTAFRLRAEYRLKR